MPLTSKGKTVATPLKFYSHKDRNVILVTAETGLCTVHAATNGVGTYAAVAEAITTDLKKLPFRSSPTETAWLAGRTGVQLAATGSDSRPSVRLSVLHLAEKSK